MSTLKQRCLAVFCALALGSFAQTAFGLASDSAMAPADKQLNALYWEGHDALKKSDWTEAFKRFQKLEKQLREKEPASVDAALYWQAYALAQAKRNAEAKAAVERLRREFPDSRWSGDAESLLRQLEPAPKAEASTGTDDELAEIAVQGLLGAPPERALPILKRVLEGKHSAKLKKRALFVLSQIDDKAATDSVLAIARGESDPDLRDEAIRMIGVGGQDKAIEQLQALYAASKDKGVRRSVLQAWLVADRKDLVVAAAKNEPDSDLRHEAVRTLGAMGGAVELRQLFDASKDADIQRAVVESLGVAGAIDDLAAIAQHADNEAVRVDALHSLGVAGGGDKLVSLYAGANTPALREAVVQGLLIAGDEKGMVELYKKSKDIGEKKMLLRSITNLGNDAALDLIDSTLKQ
jgi:HEAT repeat protein